MSKKKTGPRILLLDIETSPMEVYAWGMFDQNIGLNQVKKHTEIISWSAKWYGEKKIFYMDVSGKNTEKKMLEGMRDLLDEADIVVGHNSKRFDVKKLNARFVINNIQKPSSYRQRDTLLIAKKYFAFDSNKLEHLAHILGCKNKKLTKRDFSGFDLWKECLNGNKKAWAEMKKYNCLDTTTLEDVFNRLKDWDNTIQMDIYNDTDRPICDCGSTRLSRHGTHTTNAGQFMRYKCQGCGSTYTGKQNLLPKEKKKSLLKKL